MHHSNSSRSHRPGLGVVVCGLLTCLAAPPVVRSAEGPGQVDRGGCNGGRTLPSEDSGTTGEEETTGEMSSESTAVEGECGDGVVDEGEGCDDGNKEDGDGCPSGSGGCVAAAVCGDGILWSGKEACDDGNGVAGDGCEEDCTETVEAECGNGVMEGAEECDDGNGVDEDACTGMCKGAVCGDGIVWAGKEGCDDGNTSEEDGCPSGAVGQCVGVGECGDGFVWAGKEGCDDGNTIEEDGCPSGVAGQCAAEGVCGDGFVWEGMEECDDGNGEDVDGCNNDCAAPRWVFITSTNGNSGNLGGINGADAHCQSLADGAGLDGVYMAWLTGSDAGSAPANRFASTGYAGWYVLPTEPVTGVARGWADLTGPNEDMPENYLQAAIVVDENGIDIGDANAWTNTRFDGTAQGDDHCDGWSSGSSNHLGYTGHALG
jgi:cysteine-rich repeat protein